MRSRLRLCRRLDPRHAHVRGQPRRERAAAAHGPRRRRRAVRDPAPFWLLVADEGPSCALHSSTNEKLDLSNYIQGVRVPLLFFFCFVSISFFFPPLAVADACAGRVDRRSCWARTSTRSRRSRRPERPRGAAALRQYASEAELHDQEETAACDRCISVCIHIRTSRIPVRARNVLPKQTNNVATSQCPSGVVHHQSKRATREQVPYGLTQPADARRDLTDETQRPSRCFVPSARDHHCQKARRWHFSRLLSF